MNLIPLANLMQERKVRYGKMILKEGEDPTKLIILVQK